MAQLTLQAHLPALAHLLLEARKWLDVGVLEGRANIDVDLLLARGGFDGVGWDLADWGVEL